LIAGTVFTQNALILGLRVTRRAQYVEAKKTKKQKNKKQKNKKTKKVKHKHMFCFFWFRRVNH